MTDYEIEEQQLHLGYSNICGVDEVGRGALFGPVVAGAVILDAQYLHPGIDDSKRLPSGRRLELADFIYSHARAFAIGWSWNDEIDRINILAATKKAMTMAVRRLQIPTDYVLLDGMDPAFLDLPGKKLVGGDRKSVSIAAASIIAKVFRDDLISGFSSHFPHFDLGENKGYPTKRHQTMLLLHGMTIYHRGTFRVRWPEKTE